MTEDQHHSDADDLVAPSLVPSDDSLPEGATPFTAYGHLGSPAGITHGFRPAVGVSALLGAVAALALERRAPKQQLAPAVDFGV